VWSYSGLVNQKIEEFSYLRTRRYSNSIRVREERDGRSEILHERGFNFTDSEFRKSQESHF